MHVIVKIQSISSPETITDEIGQTIRVTKALACNNTSSVTENFYNEFCDVPQKEKTHSISHLQNFNLKRFLKSTERTQIEINESATVNTPDNFVDTETTIYKTKIISVDQKALASTNTCPDCSN